MPEVAERVELTKPVNFHSTTVVDRSSGLSLELVAVPLALLGGGDLDIDGVAEVLGLEILAACPTPAPSFLPHTVAAVVMHSTAQEAADHLLRMLETPPNQGLDGLGIDPAVMNFAIYSSFAEIVGVEESPLRGKSLAAFAAIVGGGVTIAVAAMATMTAPAAVLLGAGSIVVFGGAAGIGQLLYTKIANL